MQLFRGLGWCIAVCQRMQLLAGLEPYRFARSDADFSAGAGIAANAGLAGSDAEDAEASQFDPLACCKGLLETLEDSIHGRLSLNARQARALDYVVYDVLLNQCGYLACATGIDCTMPAVLIVQNLDRS